MVEFLKDMANKNKIPWQPEILTVGGTDMAVMQKMGKSGSISGAISIPTRHIHQVIEMAHKNDIVNCIRLLIKAIENINQWKWSKDL
jgi:endoglucanase